MRGDVRIGISGWNYPRWRKTFYPHGLRHADELAYVGERMNSVEINGSFYSLQRPECYARWRDATPPGFVFAVKGGRFITHMKKLRDVDTAVANFFASGVLALREKLGPILWQLPPNLGFDAERLDRFFTLLPRDTVAAAHLASRHDARLSGRALVTTDAERPIRHAIEIRHASYADPAFIALLRRHRVALVVADTAQRFPYHEDVTADFVYVRLHGATELYTSGYETHEIAWWARRVRSWRDGREPKDAVRIAPRAAPAAKGRDVYVYFDNDAKVRAPFDALALAAALGVGATRSGAAVDDAAPGTRSAHLRAAAGGERRR